MVGIFIIGCGKEGIFNPVSSFPSSTIEEGFLANYFCLQLNKTWKYIEDNKNENYFILKVTGTDKIYGQTCWIIETIENKTSQAIDHFEGFWYNTSLRKKIYLSLNKKECIEFGFILPIQIEGKEKEGFYNFSTPRKILDFPLEDQKEWLVSKFYLTDGVKCEYKRIAQKALFPIKVPAGEFRPEIGTFYIREIATFIYSNGLKEEILTAEYWLAPYVGIIKYRFITRRKESEGIKSYRQTYHLFEYFIK